MLVWQWQRLLVLYGSDRQRQKTDDSEKNDTARVFVFISKCKCCCLRLDLGHKVYLPALKLDVEKAKKVETKLVLDAKQEAENSSKIDNGRSKSCSTVMQSDISAHKLPKLSR